MTNHTWSDLIRRTWYAIPTAIINRMDGKTKPTERNFISVVITLVLLVLTGASIVNLSDRANFYHESLNAYMVGCGFAALIPIAVVVAVHYNIGKYRLIFVWVIAAAFAILSATVQVNIYSQNGMSAESVALGAGIPLAEILLAALDGMMIGYFAEKKLSASEQEKAEQAEEERKEQERQEREYQRELQRKADDQRLENERLDAEAKRAKRYAVVSNPVSKSVQSGAQNNRPTPIEQPEMDTEKGGMDALLDIYRNEPGLSKREAARRIGRSPQTVSNWLNQLQDEGRVHVNGIVEVQA